MHHLNPTGSHEIDQLGLSHRWESLDFQDNLLERLLAARQFHAPS